MPFRIVRDERTIDELRPRIDRRSQPRRLSVDEVDSIRRANPSVDLDRLRPGTIVRIPDEVDASREDVREDVVGSGVEAIVSALQRTLEDAAEEARGRAASDAKSRQVAKEVIERSELAVAGRRDKVLAAHVARVARRIEEADQAADEEDELREAAMATWQADLDVVQRLGD